MYLNGVMTGMVVITVTHRLTRIAHRQALIECAVEDVGVMTLDTVEFHFVTTAVQIVDLSI